MREYLIFVAFFLVVWFDKPQPGIAQATGLVAGITLAIGAASAGYGAYQTRKGQKAGAKNTREYYDAIIKNEKEARELFDMFIKNYNESAEKLEEGMTIEQYAENMIKTLGNPELERLYRESRMGDWDQAQQIADMANKQNLSAFDMAVEVVSGGDYKKHLETRNKAAVSEKAEDLYKESARLRAPKTVAGSVTRGNVGQLAVEGQRADKQDFIASLSSVRDFNKTTFERTRTIVEDDRVAAQRQQQRASEFLPLLDYSQFAAQNVVQPFNQDSLRAQLAKLQMEAQLASNAMGAAFGAPQPPPTIDTTASQALTTQGTQMALAGLSSLYKQQQLNTQSDAAMKNIASQYDITGPKSSLTTTPYG